MKYYKITDSQTIPAFGLGTWKSKKGETGQAVLKAVELGYRHIDCAPIYQNEVEIGEAFGQLLDKKRCKREDLWITSKLWNNAHAAKHVRPALERTLKDLQLDYLDLFLIHWPVHFQPNIDFPSKPEQFIAPDEIPIMETWQAMEKIVKKGLCRTIGVCNFNVAKLKNLKSQAHIQPVMNQIELHPYLQQNEMVSFCKENDLLLTAYSPLGSPDRPDGMKKDDEPSLLTHQIFAQLSSKYDRSPAQILIAWALARETVVIPKSVNDKRIQENIEATDINLEAEDIESINKLDLGYRYVDGSFFCSPGSPYSLEYLWEG